MLRGLISRICLAYLDDVIVFSRRFNQHLDDLRAVFTRILGAGLKVKPSKCQLSRDEDLYLGHIINASGVSPDPAKLRVVSTWPIPATVRDVQSFLGFVNFYGDYIAGSTRLTPPLYELTGGRNCNEKVDLHAVETCRLQQPQTGSRRSPSTRSSRSFKTIHRSHRRIRNCYRRRTPSTIRRRRRTLNLLLLKETVGALTELFDV